MKLDWNTIITAAATSLLMYFATGMINLPATIKDFLFRRKLDKKRLTEFDSAVLTLEKQRQLAILEIKEEFSSRIKDSPSLILYISAEWTKIKKQEEIQIMKCNAEYDMKLIDLRKNYLDII